MKKKKENLRFPCYKCTDSFVSWQARGRHIQNDHKPPKKVEKKFLREGEIHNLIGGTNLKLGDRVRFLKKGIVSKITVTEGSNVANIEVSVIKDTWKNDI